MKNRVKIPIIFVFCLILTIPCLSNITKHKKVSQNSSVNIKDKTDNGNYKISVAPPNVEWNITWGKPVVGIASMSNDIAVDSNDEIYNVGQFGILPGVLNTNITLNKTNSFGDSLWDITIESNYVDAGMGIATNGSEHVYITGFVNAMAPTSQDVFIAKYNNSGDLEWFETWGGSGGDFGSDIAVDSSGNIYVAGGTTSFGVINGAILILKYNSTGDLQWNETYDTISIEM